MTTTTRSFSSTHGALPDPDALSRFEGEGGAVSPTELGNADALELREDESLEGRTHHAQRVAWMAFAGVLLLAVVGVFGPGLLLTRTTKQGPLHVRYDATIRAGTLARWQLTLPRAAGDADATELFLSSSFADHVDLTNVEPTPTVVAASAEGITLAFRAARGKRSGPVHVAIAFVPLDAGDLHTELAVKGSRLSLHQWVWP